MYTRYMIGSIGQRTIMSRARPVDTLASIVVPNRRAGGGVVAAVAIQTVGTRRVSRVRNWVKWRNQLPTAIFEFVEPLCAHGAIAMTSRQSRISNWSR